MRLLQSHKGFTLAEMSVVVALVGLCAVAALAMTDAAWRRIGLNSISNQIFSLAQFARARAAVTGEATSLVFMDRGSFWECFVAVDGDGDGVNRRDLSKGIDRVESRVLALAKRFPGIGIPPELTVPSPSGRGVVDPQDPVRAGSGDIITFTGRLTATPSSVYMSDGKEEVLALRVFGPSARIRLIRWRRGWRGWQEIRR